jgi:restriction system protein
VNILELTALIIILVGLFLYERKKKYSNVQVIEVSEDFKKTLALGLYQRFCKECDETIKYSQTYLKEDPYKFEEFVSEIMKDYFEGNVKVTIGSGDFGVDIEHEGKEKVLGQVKCYRTDVGYEPIALVHSSMQKHGASRGYVVNTAGFTENAYKYVEGLDIELIDGVKLVEMWIESKKPIVQTIDNKSII